MVRCHLLERESGSSLSGGGLTIVQKRERSCYDTSSRAWRRRLWIVLAAAITSAYCSPHSAKVPPARSEATDGTVNGCTSSAKGEPGHRLLALLVGVGSYKNPSIAHLSGPPSDVRGMQELLTERYRTPRENVCVLLDAEATTASFRAAFDRTLVERAAPNDVAILYFSGHGSQTRDTNGDEPDGWDETLLLHDARADRVKDLVDDELNAMLERLYRKTHNLVVVLDSCNSGSATRDAGEPSVRARFQPPAGEASTVLAGSLGGESDPWVPASLPGAVVLTAAADGTSALEIGGRGVFTEALLQVLERPGKGTLTYAQLARQVPPLVGARSHQKPYFQGDLDRDAFGAGSRPRPASWEIRKAGPVVEIAGPPTPGLDQGAELRVYPPGMAGPDYGDPGKAKATIVVDECTGLNAKAHIDAAGHNSTPPAEGDLAILVRPSDKTLRISLRLRPEKEAGGIPFNQAADLRKRIAEDPDAKVSVVVTDGPADFELSKSPDGRFLLRDQSNVVRNALDHAETVPVTLWRHAQQRALLYLGGENGGDFNDEQTLKAEIVPAQQQEPCGEARLSEWVQGPPNGEQIIPLCMAWNIRVTLAADSPKPLLIGGVVLSTDGTTFGFPKDNSIIRLDPGKSYTFTDPFKAQPPLDARDMVRVFGTQETNPVPWNLLTMGTIARSAAATKSGSGPLFRALDRYFKPGARGVGEGAVIPIEDTTWTVSTVATQVEANPRFARADSTGEPALKLREYTLPRFDIRPYLPDDRTTALYAVLAQADALARRQVDYKQHAWEGRSDEENLVAGIDCSRAIWFAFTRAGLPYDKGDVYLTTADMAASRSPMKEYFERLDPGGEKHLGDILVYRDDKRGDGHVVMVIDPERRIAWGSHGFDGTARELPIAPQTGVEYQLIKYKPDWARWDRKNMELRAIWRYREFARQAKAGPGLPGVRALESPCDPKACPRAGQVAALRSGGQAP